jgi:hypothetical protein
MLIRFTPLVRLVNVGCGDGRGALSRFLRPGYKPERFVGRSLAYASASLPILGLSGANG